MTTYIQEHRTPFIALAIVACVAAVLILSVILPPGIDLHLHFLPAARDVMHLQSPYRNGFPSPPWLLLPMLPLSFLPENIARSIWFVISIVGVAIAAYRLGAKPVGMAVFVASPVIIHSLLNGNVDWLVLLGFTLPPPIGLFFIMVKPQMGSVVALLWLVEAWRRNGLRDVVRVFAPITIITTLSFVVFGFWPLNWLGHPDVWFNASLWPVSIPIGLALAVAALRTRKIQFAMGASPCLSPYVLFQAWSGALAALLPFSAELVAAVAGLWLLVLIRAVG